MAVPGKSQIALRRSAENFHECPSLGVRKLIGAAERKKQAPLMYPKAPGPGRFGIAAATVDWLKRFSGVPRGAPNLKLPLPGPGPSKQGLEELFGRISKTKSGP